MADIHMLTHEFRPKRGGAGVVCEKIAETLTSLGKDVTVWVPGYVAEARDYTPKYDLRILRRLKGTRDLFCIFITAREVIASRKTLRLADVYLAEPGPVEVFMLITPWFRKFWKRLVITLHGSEIVRYRRSGWWGPLFKRLCTRADLIHVLSQHNEQELLDWLPHLKPKMCRGFGMSVPHQELPEIPNREQPKETHKVNLLCVGRVHPRKGQLQLIRAISRLSPEIQSTISLRFVGQFVKGKYYKECLDNSHSLKSDIEFSGGLPDDALAAAYRGADIFALTSMPYGMSVEGLGLVYLEAASFGLPIIANRIGGVSEVVFHGENGYLSDPEDLDGLSRNIERLIKNPEIRRDFGLAGREMVESITWESVVRQMFS